MMHVEAKEHVVGGPEAGRRGLEPGEAAAGPTPFDELYEREWAGLVALGWSLTGSWSAAEELVQDGFADAYRRWSEVGQMDRPGAWVRRAVLNRATSHHRRLRVADRPAPLLRELGDAADPTGEQATDQVGDPAFWSALRSLPERQAVCLALHYLEDRSVADIADLLNCRASTVKVHLHRGRQSLARALGTAPGSDPEEGWR